MSAPWNPYAGAAELCDALLKPQPVHDLIVALWATVGDLEPGAYVYGVAWAISEFEIDRLTLRADLLRAEARIAELEARTT